MDFNDEQIERYSRHIIMPQIGSRGQRKLIDSKVLIVGAGGLGGPVALYLALAGVGTIGLFLARSKRRPKLAYRRVFPIRRDEPLCDRFDDNEVAVEADHGAGRPF